jgi:hypothetical protein
MVRALPPSGSKEVRAAAFAAQCEAGNVKIVKAAWNEAFVNELEIFPFGRHDVQIDAASDSFSELKHGGRASAGFLALIQEDKSRRAAEELATVKSTPESACPYAKGGGRLSGNNSRSEKRP